ncbi:MAG: SDR family oxidoreductase [Deltaproteobacteria bacterium]|nr:SDR family oxidoreductase [Deltaproteobacteria bacterium]
MKRLAGKRCLVTGGSRNLGRGLCLAFAREGARVAFTYHRNERAAAETRELILALGGSAPLVFQGTVTDATHAEATVAAVVDAFGGLDVLVNNAGTTQVLPFALVEEADWDHVMAVNVRGAYSFCRAALRPMIRQRGGRVLNVGSFGHDRTIPLPVHYAASKSALVGLTDALAREVGRYQILVNLLQPGLMEAGLGRSVPAARREEYLAHNPSGRLGTLEEVAATAVWLVSDENTFMTGAHVPVDGGL